MGDLCYQFTAIPDFPDFPDLFFQIDDRIRLRAPSYQGWSMIIRYTSKIIESINYVEEKRVWILKFCFFFRIFRIFFSIDVRILGSMLMENGRFSLAGINMKKLPSKDSNTKSVF